MSIQHKCNKHIYVYKKSKTAYWDYKPQTSCKYKHVFIFIHGFRGTHNGFDKIISQLYQCRIVAMDLPGFGLSERLPEKHNIKNYVQYIKYFIENLALKDLPILVGHSFGSIICSHFAVEYPNAISKLILINPIAKLANKGLDRLFIKGLKKIFNLEKYFPRFIYLLLINKFIIRILSEYMTFTKDKNLRKAIQKKHVESFSKFTSTKGLIEVFEISTQKNVMEVANKVLNKTLLILGENDNISPINEQIKLSSIIKNSNLKIISNVGHLIHYEAPQKAAFLISQFIL